MGLQELRRNIDLIDEQIVALLNRRAAEVKQAGQIKAAAGLPLVDRAREAKIYSQIAADNAGEIKTDALLRIYAQIVAESRTLQLQVKAENGEAVQ